MAFDVLKNFFSTNPFFKKFSTLKIQEDVEGDKVVQEKSVGKSAVDNSQAADSNVNQISFLDSFMNKKDRIRKYREMSFYPEISDALDNVCDEAIVENDDGSIIELKIKKEFTKKNQNTVNKEFDYLYHNVFKMNERGWDLFFKWLTEGELYLEVVLDDKKKQIAGLKLLPSFTMYPIYKGNIINGFMQIKGTDKTGIQKHIPFESNQILYSNYGRYGKDLIDVRGYLEASIKTYNQLKTLEDSLVIYRLVRAPERRVFNVYTGRMTKGKAEEYIKKLIRNYKKKTTYNSDNGEVSSAVNTQALTEDFWFAKNEQGSGSTVESLQGGVNLGELDDVIYFLKKLYKTLKLPRTRWEENSVYNPGKAGEVTREEVKFARFISRMQNRFKNIFIEALLLQLKLKGFDKKLLTRRNFDIEFTKSNLFKEFKELDLAEARLGLWSSISSYVWTPENIDGVFSLEYAQKNFFRMSDEEFKENMKLLEKEKKKAKEEEEAAAEDGEDGDFGDEGGSDAEEKPAGDSDAEADAEADPDGPGDEF